MEARDYRHLDLLTEFARDFVAGYYQVTKTGSVVSGSTTEAQQDALRKQMITSRQRYSAGTVPHAVVLQNVLNFLRDQGETGFADFARRELMNIADYGVQDVVMNYILANSASGDEDLVAQYIARRLPSLSVGDKLSAAELEALEIPQLGFARDAEHVFSEVPASPWCFHRSTPLCLVLDGRKVLGSAQRRSRGWILHHGSLVIEPHPWVDGLGALSDRLPQVDLGAIEDRMANALARALDLELILDDPRDEELELATRLSRERFA